MKKLNSYVFLLFAFITVALVIWACVVGWSAPESSKIANITALVQQFDAEGNAVNTEDGDPVPVTTTADGINAMGIIFANQLEDGILTESGIAEEEAKLANTLEVVIPAYEAKVAERMEAVTAANATAQELGALKSLNARQRKELKAAQEVQAEFKALNDTLNTYRENVEVMEENIAASIAANEEAKLNGENMVKLGTAVSVLLMWCYFLFIFALCFVVIQWVMGMFQNAGGLKSTLVALVVVAVIIGASYAIAASHGWADGATLKDAAGHDLGLGTDPATRVVFGNFEYMMADTSIIVTYVAAAGAILATIFSAIRGIFKS